MSSIFGEPIPSDYSKSAFSISTDNYLMRLFTASCIALLLVGWTLWFFLATLTFYEASQSATINTRGVIVAQFEPPAMKRLKKGQTALFTPKGATQPMHLRVVNIDLKKKKAELWPLDNKALLDKTEKTVQIKVQVEKITPAKLVLRAAGLVQK